MDKMSSNSQDFCAQLPRTSTIVFPEKISRDDSSKLCQSFGSVLVLPKSKQENEDISASANDFYDVCEASGESGKIVWLGMESKADTNEWIDSNTSNPIAFNNFVSLKGRSFDTCAFLQVSGPLDDSNLHGKWGSTICTRQLSRYP